MELSNKTLALLVVFAIFFSFFSTVSVLLKFNSLKIYKEVTGQATTSVNSGRVNLTVEQSISILLNNATIDFGTGFVNVSENPPCTNATLSIVHTEGGDNTYSDPGNCWVSKTAGQPTQPESPFEIENDGNQNLSLTITGPPPYDFFTPFGGSGNPPSADPTVYNLSFSAADVDVGACGSGETAAWTTFDGSAQPVCNSGTPDNDFGFVSSMDQIAVNIQVQIPASGIDTGAEYKNQTITFTGST